MGGGKKEEAKFISSIQFHASVEERKKKGKKKLLHSSFFM